MNNQLTLKKKREILKAYFMMFVMFLFLLSPAFSLNSYDIVFADDDTSGQNEGGEPDLDTGEGGEPDPDTGEGGEPDPDTGEGGEPDPDAGEGGEPDPDVEGSDGDIPQPTAGDIKVDLDNIYASTMCNDDTLTDPEVDLPSTEGIDYAIDGEVKYRETVRIVATAQEGYELALTGKWDFDGDQAILVIDIEEPDCSEVGDIEDKEGVVVPQIPVWYDAVCNSDGTIIMPTIDVTSLGLPIQTGILYDIFDADTNEAIDLENIQPGQTIGIIAAPYDEDLELYSPLPGWTETDEGYMVTEFTIDDPDCEGEIGEGDSKGDSEEPVDLGSGEIIKIDRDGCIVSITTSLSEGKYVLEVWDDGMKVDEVTKTVTEPGEHIFIWEITEPAMEGAPGVAFSLLDEQGNDLDFIDPYEYPASVADKCGGVTKEDSAMGEADVMGQGGPGDGLGGPAVVSADGEGHILPSTATPLFNMLVIGFALLTLGGLSLLLLRTRKT